MAEIMHSVRLYAASRLITDPHAAVVRIRSLAADRDQLRNWLEVTHHAASYCQIQMESQQREMHVVGVQTHAVIKRARLLHAEMRGTERRYFALRHYIAILSQVSQLCAAPHTLTPTHSHPHPHPHPHLSASALSLNPHHGPGPAPGPKHLS